MLSSNNILSPANGRPLATPDQDMVLGGYYLTYCEQDLTKTTVEKLEAAAAAVPVRGGGRARGRGEAGRAPGSRSSTAGAAS
jgi:hypothetical protein